MRGRQGALLGERAEMSEYIDAWEQPDGTFKAVARSLRGESFISEICLDSAEAAYSHAEAWLRSNRAASAQDLVKENSDYAHEWRKLETSAKREPAAPFSEST